MSKITVYFGQNLMILKSLQRESVDLIYIDPPFNTGKVQSREQISYSDYFVDYLGFMEPLLSEAYQILKKNGSLFLHIDYREVHYIKLLLDTIFGEDCFQNEIIWAYDYGARTTVKWPTKHDNILWYTKSPDEYTFIVEECDKIMFPTPNLPGENSPTDVWWHTIVGTNSREKTGYPTQKPRGIIDRIVKIHSKPNDILLDFFAGSGTLGESAFICGRDCILIDGNQAALKIMEKRFLGLPVNWINWTVKKVNQKELYERRLQYLEL